MTTFFQAIVGGIATGAVYALIGLAYNVVFSGSGVFNLAQGQIMMLGIMLIWQFRQVWGWPTGLAIAAAIVSCVLANVIVELTTVAPLRRGSMSDTASVIVPTLVTTLGASIVITGLAVELWGPTTRSFSPYFPFVGLHIGSVIVTKQDLLMLGTALLLMAGYIVFTARSRWGTALFAMSEDPEAASMRGIPVARSAMLAFGLGGLISGVAGAVLGPIAFANPNLGFSFGFLGFIAIAIGGFGSVTGAVVGGFTLGIAESMTDAYWSGQYTFLVDLLLVLAVLYIKPRGLFVRSDLRVA